MEKQIIIAALEAGAKFVTFQKKDGEVCTRRLTMNPSEVPEFVAKTERVTRQSADTIRAWDLDRGKWVALLPSNTREIVG